MAKEKTTDIDLHELKKELVYNWKTQTANQYSAIMVAYIDARDDQDLLDKVCGPENWQCEFYELKGRIFCRIGIFLNDQWVWKSDCGSESNIAKEKGEASDAFKRAGVQWGIGRFLYGLPELRWRKTIQYGKTRTGDPAYRFAHNGEIVWDKAKITALCNEEMKAIKSGRAVAKPTPPPASAPAEGLPASRQGPPTQPAPPDDKKQTHIKQAKDGLLMLTNGDRVRAKAKLKKLSSFKGRDDKIVSWEGTVEDFAIQKEKWFYRTLGKIKAEVEQQGPGVPTDMQNDEPAEGKPDGLSWVDEEPGEDEVPYVPESKKTGY